MKAKTVLLSLVATATLMGTAFESQAQTDPPKVTQPKFVLAKLTLGTRISAIVARHGNPTALAVAVEGADISKPQAPPQPTTTFGMAQLPDWAKPVSPKIIDNHVLWLYQRDTYTMSFSVDRLGFIDAVLVAGNKASALAPTGLGSPKGPINLGDDMRRILVAFGYPNSVVSNKQPKGKASDSTLIYNIQDAPMTSVIFTFRNYRVARIHIYSLWD